jgi:hypothetical protein
MRTMLGQRVSPSAAARVVRAIAELENAPPDLTQVDGRNLIRQGEKRACELGGLVNDERRLPDPQSLALQPMLVPTPSAMSGWPRYRVGDPST